MRVRSSVDATAGAVAGTKMSLIGCGSDRKRMYKLDEGVRVSKDEGEGEGEGEGEDGKSQKSKVKSQKPKVFAKLVRGIYPAIFR